MNIKVIKACSKIFPKKNSGKNYQKQEGINGVKLQQGYCITREGSKGWISYRGVT